MNIKIKKKSLTLKMKTASLKMIINRTKYCTQNTDRHINISKEMLLQSEGATKKPGRPNGV